MSRLAMHWMRVHQDGSEFNHIAAMQYHSIKLFDWMWKDRDFCNNLLAAAPQDSLILLRDQPLSEQKNDMYTDPVGTGNRHADEWAQKWQQGQVCIPPDRAYPLGINEPESNTYQRQIDQYTEAFCRRLSQHGFHGGAYSFGVGHPSTQLDPATGRPDPKGQPDWHWYEASHQAIVQGQHLVILHEYGLPDNFGWGYWCNRLSYCPWQDIRIVIGECGVDGGLGGRPQTGWKGYGMTPDAYTHWLDTYMVALDGRVHSCMPFTWDYAHPWDTFDVKELRTLWEGYAWQSAPVTPPVEPPVVTPPPTTLPPLGDKWNRSIEFVLKWEGGYQNIPADDGNWTGCAQGKGELKGTKYGISACSYPTLDIANLTEQQARAIYHRDYWQASGADKLPWPLCLLVFDTAVLHGVGTAKAWLTAVGANPYAFAAKRLSVYTHSHNWNAFGAGWCNRLSDLLREMGGF